MTILKKKRKGSREYAVVINPATMQELDEVKLQTQKEINDKITQADAAFSGWGATTLQRRIGYMRALKQEIVDNTDLIAQTISDEMGKPRVEAIVAEIMTVVDLIAYYTKIAPSLLVDKKIDLHLFKWLKSSRLVYEPLGVVAVIAPWNFPFAIPMSGIVSALLTGNTVVFKPASDALLIGQLIEKLIRNAGIPEGVFETVLASGASIGTALYEPPIKKVVFTGSTEVGKKIMSHAGKFLIPTVMELGGKDPMIVLDDADLDKAVQGALWGSFTNAGQVCASVERLYVDASIYEPFMSKFRTAVAALRVGSGDNPDSDVGPVVNQSQLDIVTEHIASARKAGANISVGGEAAANSTQPGYFFQPTIIEGADHSMQCVQEETFGPTVAVIKYAKVEDAIAMANDSPYGLTASVWGQDKRRADKVARRLHAGTIMINDVGLMSYGITDTPWQGVKDSGVGMSHSAEGLLAFVFAKHIAVDNTPPFMKRQLWWYPYSAEAYGLFKNSISMVFGTGKKLSSAGGALKALLRGR